MTGEGAGQPDGAGQLDDAGQTDDPGQVGERLSAWLASELPAGADVKVRGLRRASAGMSRENWIFDAVRGRPAASG